MCWWSWLNTSGSDRWNVLSGVPYGLISVVSSLLRNIVSIMFLLAV